MPNTRALVVKLKGRTKKFWLQFAALIVGTIVVLTALVGVSWYQYNLQPIDSANENTVRFKVKQGEGNATIAQNLEDAGIIRSSTTMVLYLKFAGKPASLKAGTYAIAPSLSVPQIVEHLEGGKTDTINVTILPGRTLAELKKDLTKYGFTSTEIDTAFNATYSSPLLADKPADADLEGYIFPETFEVDASDDLSVLFERSFDTLYTRMQQDGLLDDFKTRGLNIHQALTLASIIQKEASDPKDQPQIAQVFLSRLSIGMKLESDVTFHYGAEKMGVEPRVDLQSPYNTRLVPGFPPTPISTMNYSALQAVASPAPGDYIYFIAGDDGVVYFARTFEQHQVNIEKHCQKLCGNAF